MQKAVRWFLVALFSSIIFIINFFVPLPINYLLIVVEAVMLSLASLFIRRAGATSVGIVGGLLSALSQPAFGPFTFLFTFLFGLLVDIFSHVFKVFTDADRANRNRVILSDGIQYSNHRFLELFRNQRLHKNCRPDSNVVRACTLRSYRQWHKRRLCSCLFVEQISQKH